jgi:hypothetical protein
MNQKFQGPDCDLCFIAYIVLRFLLPNKFPDVMFQLSPIILAEKNKKKNSIMFFIFFKRGELSEP